MEKMVAYCGLICIDCDDYPVDGDGCEKLMGWFEQVPDSRAVLDAIRQSPYMHELQGEKVA